MSPAHYGKFVAYFRVSTDRQGKSGLGLEAQRKSVLDFLDGGRWSLVAEFTEVESGKRSDRPQLAKSLDVCRRQKAKLVIAKLDRLSRNLAFIATLMESGVEFVAVDNPHANKLTVHILAAVAQHEREMISERTKAALSAARARGTRHRGAEGEREAVCGQRAADHPRDREGRRREPQCHRRKAQRAQRSHGTRRQVDACTGRGGASPFGGRRRQAPSCRARV
jgi:DNA invertase Pin-like site-specific DNA recombinase